MRSPHPYDPVSLEAKWQKKWRETGLYRVPDEQPGKENYYQLVEFSYPSGNLHVGHWYAFAVPDIHARFLRMQGYNVLYPMGFDAFGLPAENAAIKHGLSPRNWTYQNMAHMRKQLESMGAMFDWDREVVTCDPEYYRFTQWLFIQLFRAGLAEQKETLANWCPEDRTVLANEQVIGGACERCGTPVEKKVMKQWQLGITKYAERLIADLDGLEWPEEIKAAQRNWIGKSVGTEIVFYVADTEDEIRAFTTRADTLFGCTYVVVSPEHPLLERQQAKIANWPAVEAYRAEAAKKSDVDRTDASREKTGVRAEGLDAAHPVTGERLPIFVADYVLGSYGTGAVMGVPAHDERDFAFAKKYGLPIKTVVEECAVTEGEREDAFRPGERVEPRSAVAVGVYDPKRDAYLSISWKAFEMRGVVTGGIEEGEDIETAARREVLEETGYKNLRLVAVPEMRKHTKFYHRNKRVNRHSTWSFALFELVDDERQEMSTEDQAQHEVVWLPRAEAAARFTVAEARWVAELFEDRAGGAMTEEGILVNSGEFDGLSSAEARERIGQWLAEEGLGGATTTYRLRDWGVSRQRYWGCPIPLIHCEGCGWQPVPDDQLPVLLPEVEDYLPNVDGRSPLSKNEAFVNTVCPKCEGPAVRETDTLDTFVDSSWYFLRYCDARNQERFADPEKLARWMPVDFYSGGAEHTTMHLLYSRFFHKALFDLGLVNESEPYVKRVNRGLILGPDGQKMSKSKGNVLDPDDIVSELGADTLRLYLAFIGPYNEVGQYPWSPEGIAGVYRFLERVWKLMERVTDAPETAADKERVLERTLRDVTESIRTLKMNTGVAALMSCLNTLRSFETLSVADMERYALMLAPYAPHMAEELWERLGHHTSIFLESWPAVDESKLRLESIALPVQVNGKVRATVMVAPDADEESVREAALANEGVQKALSGKEVRKTVYVPGRIMNLVV